jgi:hypothetical protein
MVSHSQQVRPRKTVRVPEDDATGRREKIWNTFDRYLGVRRLRTAPVE